MKNYTFYVNAPNELKRNLLNYFRDWIRMVDEDSQKIRNLWNEHFLPETVGKEIFDILIDSLSDEFSETLEKLCFHADKNFCKGGNIIVTESKIHVGSVMPKISFVNYLSREYLDLFANLKEIESFIDLLCLNPKLISSKFYEIKLRQPNRIIWVTWDRLNYESNPFNFLKSKYAEEVRTALGLGFKTYEKKELIGFILPVNVKFLLKPTICDSGYNVFFRPTAMNENDFGIIRPLNNGNYQINLTNFSLSEKGKKLPESVNFSENYSIKDVETCISFITI